MGLATQTVMDYFPNYSAVNKYELQANAAYKE